MVRLSARSSLACALAGVLSLAACSDDVAGPVAVSGAPAADLSEMDASTFLVQFTGSNVPADFAANVQALGGSVVFAHGGAGVAAVSGLSDAAALQLGKKSGVQSVVADAVLMMDPMDASEVSDASVESPSDPTTAGFYARQWDKRAISAPAAWSAGRLGSPTVRVGVLDTGLGYTHSDLAGRVDLALSRSFVPAEDKKVAAAFPGAHPVADLHYHGTHVGATIASNGIAAAGVSSKVTLVGLKVCTSGTAATGFRASCPTNGTLNAILYAADQGLDVINLSLGGSFLRRDASAAGGNGPSFLATINRVMAYANRKGVTVVVSAGNAATDMDHDGNSFKSYCTTAHVICVSATGPTSRQSVNGPWANVDAPAVYTNFGRSAVSVAAPGGNSGASVTAACSPFSAAIPDCRKGTGYVVGLSGTSMASPQVAGLAALLAEQFDSPSQIRGAIESSADDLGATGTDPYYGKGRINVARALGL